MEKAQNDAPIDENPSINISVSTNGAAANAPGLSKYCDTVRTRLRSEIKETLSTNAKHGAAAQTIEVINTIEKAKQHISGRKIDKVHVRITGKREGAPMLLHYPFRPTGE